MPSLSVVIPSRNEPWLLQTIESIRSSIRADTEIIAVIDGEESEPKVPDPWPVDGGPPVRIIRNASPIGQRQSINLAVRESRADFIIKTDAHSMFAEGFDVALMAECEPDWTVIPRMWNLHSHDMVCVHCGERYYNRPPMNRCEKCGSEKIGKTPAIHREITWRRNKKKSPTDWMWFRSPTDPEMPMRVQYWDAPTARAFPAEYNAHRAWAKRQGEIAEVMTGQGACWLMRRERYWQLGGMDEAHGHWGQMGVEVACKSWLSGGQQMVNRRTWFAHLFRCGASEGCPWEMSGRQQDEARRYSIDLWSNNKWSGQTRPLSWLIEHFWPVPTWDKPETNPELRDANDFDPTRQMIVTPDAATYIVPEAARTPDADTTLKLAGDLTILAYTDASLPMEFSSKVARQLEEAAGGVPIIRQVQPADWPRSHESIYRNILAGLDKVTTPYVALAEHDVLYPKGYFDHRPTADVEYNKNRWCLHVDLGAFSRRPARAMSQLIARTEALKKDIAQRLVIISNGGRYEEQNEIIAHFEPGDFEQADNSLPWLLPPLSVARWSSELPTIDISGHGYNLTVHKQPIGRLKPRVKPWGTAAEVMERFAVPRLNSIEPKSEPVPKAETGAQPMVSVLIPARNEVYLSDTVRDLLKNLRLSFEILVGLDGKDQDPAQLDVGRPQWPTDPRVRIIVSDERIGMRPMINKLAKAARGTYLLRMDAHCMVAEGIDEALVGVCQREGHVTVVAKRYELDPRRWQRREKTDTPCRRLTHESEDGCGLRSLPWPEYDEAHKDEEVSETMTCSGSSWTCLRSTFVDWWGGFDERHGTFGQEGCEIACMTWLSGGRFLVHKGTWYAHWNRGKSTYTLGAHTKEQSIDHSKWLWVGNNWKYARYGFDWLIEKFNPPGWPAPGVPDPVKALEQRALVKTRKRLRVDDLWAARDAIADPGKRHRLTIFWKSYDEFVRAALDDKPQMDGQYRHYLLSHVNRHPGQMPTLRDVRKVDKSLVDSLKLIRSVKAEGLKSPMEFYAEDGRMILWKGYRRLVIARAVGIPRVVGRCYADRKAAGSLSPQANLTRIQPPPISTCHDLGAEQFRKWGAGATDKYFTHVYTRYYDMHLQATRKRTKKVLELGLLEGASLALWREYFPRAEIVGFDCDPDRWAKFTNGLKNIRVFTGDERNLDHVNLLRRYGPYDLIVDDASHDPEDQRRLFGWLWPCVRQYGWYVIEDIFRSYDQKESEKGQCLPAGLESRIYRERDVLQIHHYYNIVFIQKA